MTNHPPIPHWRIPLQTIVICAGILVMLMTFSQNAMAYHKGGAADETDHPLHPVQAGFSSKISGWLIGIAQGTSGSNDPSGQKNDSGEGSASLDLFYEAELNGNSAFMMHLDAARGAGLGHIPALAAAPNGNPTGTNSDLEFDDDQIHLVEAWYATTFDDGRWTLTFGQIDPTGFFDANNFANDERTQFLANLFVNNPMIEWGGDPNFYGAGFVAAYVPTEQLEITIGALDGDGDYTEVFDKPFIMGQVNLILSPGGKEGIYRFYAWQNSLPHYEQDGDGNVAFVTAVGNPSLNAPTVLIGDKNTGFGISLDQALTDHVGLWARLGMQDGDVAQFDRHAGLGLQLSGNLVNRPDDVMGIGVGFTMISDAYQEASGFDDDELYAEAYYNMAVKEGFNLSPDIQYVSNPGGDGSQDPFLVYGVRAGVMF